MIQQYKFVQNNISMLQKLMKQGYISPKLLVYYDIFQTYQTIKEKSRINRYKIVAEMKGQSTSTVRRAVYEMKKYVAN